jgi:hypothetical protein
MIYDPNTVVDQATYLRENNKRNFVMSYVKHTWPPFRYRMNNLMQAATKFLKLSPRWKPYTKFVHYIFLRY